MPSWRLDVTGEADLAEEVGRHVGLDKIPPALPPAGRVGGLRRSQRRERQIREILTGVGFTEVVNYAFVAGAEVAPAPGVRLANPLTVEQDTLRTSLVMPGLVTTLRSNLRLGRRDLARVRARARVPSGAASGPWSSAAWASCSRASGTRATGRRPRAPSTCSTSRAWSSCCSSGWASRRPVWDREAPPPGLPAPRARRAARAGRTEPRLRRRAATPTSASAWSSRTRRWCWSWTWSACSSRRRNGPASACSTATPRSIATCRSCATKRRPPPRSTRACARRRASGCAR